MIVDGITGTAGRRPQPANAPRPFSESQTLLMVFGRTLMLTLCDEELAGRSWYAHGRLLRPVSASCIPCFYDHLIGVDGNLVGLRLWPVPGDFPRVIPVPEGARYLYLPSDSDFLDVFFTGRVEQQVRNDSDQNFGGAAFLSEDGLLAVAVDFLSILPSTKAREAFIENAVAEWGGIHRAI